MNRTNKESQKSDLQHNDIKQSAVVTDKAKTETITLAIETSCDETSAAVLVGGRELLSNEIYTQIDLHKNFGGVVPEIASRNHLVKLPSVVQTAIAKAGITLEDIDQIAVTSAPGLVGALLVGVSYAKGLSYSLNVPLISVHHIAGHIAANYIEHKELKPPFLSLVVSGGHTQLILVEDYTRFKIIGRTRDDASGEAFDKIARALGLGYPGGPLIDKYAREGDENAIKFPIANVGDNLDFSFSGLKSAVLNYINQQKMKGEELHIPNICASFQKAVIDSLVQKSMTALKELGLDTLVLAGGVAANSKLKSSLQSQTINGNKIKVYYPSAVLCTDNAAMIGSAGYYYSISKDRSPADYSLNAVPSMDISDF